MERWKRSLIVLGLCLVATIAARIALERILEDLPAAPGSEPKDIPTYEEVMTK